MYSSLQRWSPPPLRWNAKRACVQVWLSELDQPAIVRRRLEQTLSPAERTRVQRYRLERDRQHAQVSRGLLRTILASYLECAPASLCFVSGPHGKPALAASREGSTLRFNVSHSQGLALYAISVGREVGVDIEYMRPLADVEQIARHCFSAHEWACLQDLPEELKQQAFYRCWTRKEAYSKATGEGLSKPLGHFDVSLLPDEPARLLRVQGEAAATSQWSLQDLPTPTGYAAALAVEGQEWELLCWSWTEQEGLREAGMLAVCGENGACGLTEGSQASARIEEKQAAMESQTSCHARRMARGQAL